MKADARQIRAFLQGLRKEHSTDAYRSAWPKYVFRFDNIVEVASILSQKRLYSRQRCDELDIKHHDAANPGIIQQTAHAHCYVRLYFGPRTPTQYRNEGIRPSQELTSEGAHCPVPVFLLFDSQELLTQKGVFFTNGNFAYHGQDQFEMGDSADFLSGLPFEAIYHRGIIHGDQDERSLITFHRHAEVLVQDELGLDSLKWIVCRTGPERDTLLSLLKKDAKSWESVIRLEGVSENFFERRGTYVEKVVFSQSRLTFTLRPKLGPFEVALTLRDPRDGSVLRRQKEKADRLGRSKEITVPKGIQKVHVILRIDGHLAYNNVVTQQTLYP